MAGAFRVGFFIEGDASDALRAVNRLAQAIDRLASVLERIEQRTADFSQRTQRATNQARQGWERAAAGVERYARAISRAASVGPPAVPAAGGAGGGAIPPSQALAVGDWSIDPRPINQAGATAQSVLQRLSAFGSSAAGIFTNLGSRIGDFANRILPLARTRVDALFTSLSSHIGRAIPFIQSFSRGFLILNDAVRVAAQGVTNLGRAWFFFLSLPLVFFLVSTANSAINYNDALVRVQKTTELTNQELGQLDQLLRGLARTTKTSHVGLAEIAEQIGQMGVTSVNAIYNLTQIFEMLAVTTDLTAGEVALEMGRIANAFQWNLNASSDEVFRLANVINYLENTTAASAKEIIKSMAKWAQSAQLLKINAAEAAGFSAAMVSMGLSEEEAGTALKRMSTQLIAHADRVAELMGAYDKYADKQRVLNAINENAVQVFLDIANAAAKAREAGQSAEALDALINIGDARGGRALAALASNIDFVNKVLADANGEWERHNSLINEYNRAMSSTKSHVAVLRNNINDAAIMVGDTLLPVINQIITILIPAIQMASTWFKGLNKQTQLMAVGLVLVAVAGGPLLMLLGQILHGFVLITMGFGLVLKFIPFLLTAIKSLLPVFSLLIKGILSWQGMVVVAVAAVLKILTKFGVDVSGFFLRLAQSARSWGERLMETYGNGLAAGARFVLNVIARIAELIASFFEAHSPPKAGPLSTIDRWGAKLLQTYLMGFRNADFSVLSDIGRTIERMLTRGVEDDDLPVVLQKYAQARVKLASLIDKFNKTGLVDEGLLDEVTAGLGDMADKMKELIRLQLQYNSLQRELDELEKRRKGVLKTYDDEIAKIASSNMSVDEKVAAIRSAQRARDSELRGIEEEKRGLEEQADIMKEQLDFQRSMIDAMNDQEDIFARIADALDKLAGSLKGVGVDGFSFDFDDSDIEKVVEDFAEAQEQVMSFIERIEEGRKLLQGFFDGFSGKEKQSFWKLDPFTGEVWRDDETQGIYDTLYNIGEKAAQIRDAFQQASTTLSGWGESLSKAWESLQNIDLGKALSDIGAGIGENPIVKTVSGWVSSAAGFLGTVFGPLGSTITQNLGRVWDSVVNVWNTTLKPALADLGAAFSNWGAAVAQVWAFVSPIVRLIGVVVGAVIMGLIGFIGSLVNGVIMGVEMIITFGGLLLTGLVQVFTGIFNFLVGIGQLIWGIIVGIFTGNWDMVLTGLQSLWNGVIQVFTGIVNSIVGILGAGLGFVIGIVVGFVQGVIAFFTGLFNSLVGHSIIPDMMQGILTSIQTKLNEALTFITTILGKIKAKFSEIWGSIKSGVSTKFGEIVSTVQTKIAEIKSAIANKVSEFVSVGADIIGGLESGIQSKVGSIIASVRNAVSSAINAAKGLLGIKSPSRVFEGFGENTALGYVRGIQAMMSEVNRAVGSFMVTPALSAMSSTPSLAFAAAPVFPSERGGGDTIILQFGRDSVRSDDDINRIAEAVERVLTKKARGQLGFASGRR